MPKRCTVTEKLCFFCSKWGIKDDFDLGGLKLIFGHDGFKFCQKCTEWGEKRMAELEKKVYVLNPVKPFLPPIVESKNYQDRESNDGSLIE